MGKRLGILAAAAFMVSAGLTACGGQDDGGDEADTTAELREIPSDLVGSFTARIQGDGDDVQTGTWELFLVDGKYVLRSPDGELSGGDAFQLEREGRIHFVNNPRCREIAIGPGVYTYEVTGGTVRFIEVEDPCVPRLDVLSGGRWQAAGG